MRIDRLLRSTRRRLAVALALLALGGVVAAHHGVVTDMHHMPAGAICLAILAGTAAVAVALGRVAVPATSGLTLIWTPVDALPPIARSVPARAGPIFLALAVIRR